MNLDKLKLMPFYLSDDDLSWVLKTYNNMTLKEKIGQLFFMVGRTVDYKYYSELLDNIKPGGIMFRSLKKEEIISSVEYLQKGSKIPLLVSANLESGGYGITTDGTKVGSNMMVSATNDSKYAYLLGKICAIEGKSVGINYSFAPVCDIDFNFRNPITNTRTFGSDKEKVLDFSKEYLKGCQEENVAVAIKHFPGDGVDERDQHLVTTINDLSISDYDDTYGYVYKGLIDLGAKTVMVGHIMQPAYSKHFNPKLEDKDVLPASLSKELLNDLLRQKLGFNGLIITDATTMSGFNIPMSRSQSVPYSIACGCDMFLFSKNLEEDYNFMLDGYNNKIITDERLEEAVLRILALKASLKLHTKNNIPNLSDANKNLKTAEAIEIAKEIAKKSITLVKEEKGVLPLNTMKYKRILLHSIDSGENKLGYIRTNPLNEFKEKLENEGFQVTVYSPKGNFEGIQEKAVDTINNYDLIIYLCNLATKSNQTTVRIEWTNPMGVNVPYYINSVPTIFISLENPYHLLDVPRIKTFINTYGINEGTIEALVNKLTGKEKFEGVSPVDPFLGRYDTRL